MHSKLWLRAPLVAALALSVATGALADENKGRKKGRPHQVVPTGAEDAKAPTPADLAAEAELERITSRSDEGLVEVLHADGTVSVDLEGRFQHVLVKSSGADGSASYACSTHPGEQVALPAAQPAQPIGREPTRVVVPLPRHAPTTPAVEER
jgi:hypothetical protein